MGFAVRVFSDSCYRFGARVWVSGCRVGDFELRFRLVLALGSSFRVYGFGGFGMLVFMLTWSSEPDLASLSGFGHGDMAFGLNDA